MGGCCPDLGLDDINIRLGPSSIGVSVQGRPFDASDPIASDLEHWQFVLGEGPSSAPNAIVERIHADLATRWPALSVHLAARSVATVVSLPMALDRWRPFGALTLYRYDAGALSGAQLRLLRAAARETSYLVADHVTTGPDDHEPGCGLHGLARFDQAIGVVMQDLGVGPDTAAVRIRSHSFANDCRVERLVTDIVEGRVRLAPH
jgi:hypothetical protein